MRESSIERNLREKINKMGGLALKFIPTYWVGAPDRIVLLPGGKIHGVETKRAGEDLRETQKSRKKQLERLGFKVFKVDCKQSLDSFLQEVGNEF